MIRDCLWRTRSGSSSSTPGRCRSYDTAWVAMVPAPGSPQASRFPQCVDWILRNQRGDGSWGSAPGRDIGGKPWSLLGDFVILEDLPVTLRI